jgi:hypothetical protein
MADPDDIPGRTVPTNTTGGESDALAQRPDPVPNGPQRATFPEVCKHRGCSEPAEPGSAYCSNPMHGPSGEFLTRPRDLFTRPDSDPDNEIAQLRRDVSRLEGKVDALLEALEVGDGDG